VRGIILSTAVAANALCVSAPLRAEETLKFAPAPAWIVPQPILPPSPKEANSPVAILLHDQQTVLEPGKISTFSEVAFKIQKPEGLSAGNLSIAWNPATDTVTVHTLEIRRADKIIDVLKAGQTFTTMRRESNLDLAVLDGVLTANIQPEGLQQGDVVVLATTTEHVDPVLKGHVETLFAPWGAAQMRLAHVRLTWPTAVDVRIQTTGDLPPGQKAPRDGKNIFELAMRDVEPVIPPKGAPTRFRIGRMGEASDFRSWSEVASLMVPLYKTAAAIPASGPLRDEVERIRKASNDPKTKAEQALQLVEQRVRYVALLMGQGGYVPASAETTWSRRFGDCKAKTVLLLALLHELGISAEPVLVNSTSGDAVRNWVPMMSVFDHVLVRAHIGNKTYWLDGTRTSDVGLDAIPVPKFGWGLPVVESGSLVQLLPVPLDVPETETQAAIDASQGIYAPAPAQVDKTLRGDTADFFANGLSALTEAQRQEFFKTLFRADFDLVTVKSASYAFDKTKHELRITGSGDAKLDWSGGYFHVPDSTVGFNPDFDRPMGPEHDAPFAVSYPAYAKTVTRITLPPTFLNGRQMGRADVRETLAGVEYRRTSKVEGNVLVVETSSRSLTPEIDYKEALASRSRLKTLSDEDVALPLPSQYRPTDKDLIALASEKPTSHDQFLERGLAFLDSAKYDEAISDFDQALVLEPNDVWALADRAMARVSKRDFARAAQDLAAAQKIDPDNPVIFRARGLEAEMTGDSKGAVEYYSKSLERDPRNAFALTRRAMAYHAIGDDAKALADSDEALKITKTIDLRLMRANIFLTDGKTDAASTEAALMRTENPESDYAMVAAARIYARLGLKKEAVAGFDKALALKRAAYIYVNRADSHPLTEHAARIADLDKALALEPNNVDALTEKAEELAAMGQFQSAVELYDRALASRSDNFTLKVYRATLTYEAGDKTAAEKALTSLRAQAKTTSDFNNLCWRAATLGILLDAAAHDCEQALRLKPDNAAALDSLAFVKLRQGKLEEAISLYGRAIAGGTGAASYMGRAIARARTGDKVRAAADRAEAIKRDPDAETRYAEYGLTYQ
jgi:tetratricopeptide (TPR) repeat protein